MAAWSLIRNIVPAFQIEWRPPYSTGYFQPQGGPHVLVLRFDPARIKTLVLKALEADRRTKMKAHRLFGTSLVVWTGFPNWRIQDHVDVLSSFADLDSNLIPLATRPSALGVIATPEPSKCQGHNICKTQPLRPWRLVILRDRSLALLICDPLLLETFTTAAEATVAGGITLPAMPYSWSESVVQTLLCDTSGLKPTVVNKSMLVRNRNNAARTTKPGTYLHRPAVSPRRPHLNSSFQALFFHQDPSSLNRIAVKCACNIKVVILVLIVHSVRRALGQAGQDIILLCEDSAIRLQDTPKDIVACLRYFRKRQLQGRRSIDDPASEWFQQSDTSGLGDEGHCFILVTFLRGGNKFNDLVCHFAPNSAAQNIAASINVVISNDEGIIISFSHKHHSRGRKEAQLEADSCGCDTCPGEVDSIEITEGLERCWRRSVLDLSMDLRLNWQTESVLDPKLDVNLTALCQLRQTR